MNALVGLVSLTALLAAAGCAQMRPPEAAREAPASEPAGASPILRGEEAPPLPEQIPPLPPEAGQSDFPML